MARALLFIVFVQAASFWVEAKVFLDTWALEHRHHGSVTPAILSIQWLDLSIDPLAVCNDGTTGAYYYSSSLNKEMSDIIVIMLPGGGQCYDEQSCADRWQVSRNYMSSSGFSSAIEKAGILDTDPSLSPLWAAQKAVLGYCSSDGYMGDAAAGPDTWNWAFRGQRLVLAMVGDLVRRGRITSHSTILLAGVSAGARGMMTLADTVLPLILPAGAKIGVFLDSPYYIDIAPYVDPSMFAGFPYEEQNKLLHDNTTAVLSAGCLEGRSEDKAWQCQFGQYRLPSLTSLPFLLIAGQFDSYQLSNNLQASPPYWDQAQVDFAKTFAQYTTGNFTSLIATHQRSSQPLSRGYLSWACYNHAVSESSLFSTVATIDGTTIQLALTAFLATDPFVTLPLQQSEMDRIKAKKDRRGKLKKSQLVQDDQVTGAVSKMVWIDSCNGFACGTGCVS